MDKHPSARQLLEYGRRELPPDVFLAVREHLLSCPLCAEGYDIARPLLGDYLVLEAALLPGDDEPPFHLTEQEALEYARGRADRVTAEIADAHLEACAECSVAVSTFRGTGLDGVTPAGTGLGVGPISHPAAHLFATHGGLWLSAGAVAVVIAGLLLMLLSRGDIGQRHETPQVAKLPTIDSQPTRPQEAVDRPKSSEPERHEAERAPGPARPSGPRREREVGGYPHNAITVLRDGGHLISVSGAGEVTGLPKMPDDLRTAVTAAVVSARVETPGELAPLRGSRSVLMGGGERGEAFRLLSPIGVVTADEQPRLKWSPLPGATSYTVAVTTERYDEIVTSPPLPDPEWRVPVPLARGKMYAWQVTARREGEDVLSPAFPAPAARFKVLDLSHLVEIRRAERLYADSHLILGVVYSRAGLTEEALREFRALSESNPDSEVALKLLRSVP